MRLILGRDPDVISELITTTESSTPNGGKVYHPQKRDEDHNTDGFRALVMGIRDLPRDGMADADSFGGWAVPVPYGGVGVGPDYNDGSTFRPPWDLR